MHRPSADNLIKGESHTGLFNKNYTTVTQEISNGKIVLLYHVHQGYTKTDSHEMKQVDWTKGVFLIENILNEIGVFSNISSFILFNVVDYVGAG